MMSSVKLKSLPLFSLVLVFTFSLAARADDLLDILDSEAPSEALVQEKHDLVDAVAKKIGKKTAEQNIFLNFLKKDNFEKALFQWWVAFEDTSFESSPTGQALFAYLLFKNSMPINGIESLFRVSQPSKIEPELVRMWKLVAPSEHKVWSFANLKWSDPWTQIFDSQTEIEVESRQFYDPKKTETTMALLKKTKLKTRARAWLEWQIALGLALNGGSAKAAKVLAHLLKGEQNLISRDLVHLTAARLLYERGFLDAALKYYNRIPKTSEYWFTAQEEVAWSYIRKGQPQDTLAVTKTLMIPEFGPQVGPETVMLRSLGQLKVCDYPGVVETITEFRQRFKPRAFNLQSVTKRSDHPATLFLLKKLQAGRVQLLKLGEQARSLPRYVSRDEVLYGLAQSLAQLTLEAKQADDMYARSISGGTAKVGFQAQLDQFRTRVVQRHRSAKNAAIARVQKLAKEELGEIKRVLNKMHVVEAEVIQQINMAEKVARASVTKKPAVKRGSTGSKDKYALTFPFEGELWFDEVANFKVDIKKGCQAKRK